MRAHTRLGPKFELLLNKHLYYHVYVVLLK